MSDSIFDTIKKMLGLDPDYDPFDVELQAYINSALIALKQIGVGTGLIIAGHDETFEDLTDNEALVPLIKHYIYLKVKTVWDVNSLNSNTLSALKEQIVEDEWRIREENEKVIYNETNV